MPGRGPAPKVGERLGHRSKAERERARSAVTSGARRPVPPGRWHRRAKAWWEAAGASDGASVWDDAGWALAERLLLLVDRFHRLIDADELDQALKVYDRIRLSEPALFLPPVDRFRAIRDGVVAPVEPAKAAEAPASSGAASRARLRAVSS
jgi:hypothetical protein